MLSYGCIVCERHGFDARLLVKHLVEIHEPMEKEIYDKEVKVLHYGMLQIALCKARIRARAAEIQRGEAKAELEIAMEKARKREEDQLSQKELLLVKHAEQLSQKEAQLQAE